MKESLKITLLSTENPPADNPPFIALSVASYLEKKGIISPSKIQVLDAYQDKRFFQSLLAFRPNLVTLFATTPSYQRARLIAKRIKKFLNVPFILGGSHITAIPHLLEKPFSVGIIGEPEKTFAELVNTLKSGSLLKSKLKNIPGLVFHQKGKVVQTRPKEPIKPLDEIPPLNYNLSPIYSFDFGIIIDKNKPLVVKGGFLGTSRGCPYQCIFCARNLLWQGKVRFHSSKRVAEDIERLVKVHKVKCIRILDSTFVLSKKRLKEIIEKLRKKGILGKVFLVAYARTDTIDEEMCQLLRKLGVVELAFGFESGSNRILRALKSRTTTVAVNRKAVLLCQNHGLFIRGSVMFGSPGETLEDFQKSLQFMEWLSKKENVLSIRPNVTVPFPGTKLWESLSQKAPPSWQELDPDRRSSFYKDSYSQEEFTRVVQRAEEIAAKILRKKKKRWPNWEKFEKEAKIRFTQENLWPLLKKNAKLRMRDKIAIFSPKNLLQSETLRNFWQVTTSPLTRSKLLR